VSRLTEELATLAVLVSVAVLSGTAAFGDATDVASTAAVLASAWLITSLTVLVRGLQRRVDATSRRDRTDGP
jgi:hypothetical protein